MGIVSFKSHYRKWKYYITIEMRNYVTLHREGNGLFEKNKMDYLRKQIIFIRQIDTLTILQRYSHSLMPCGLYKNPNVSQNGIPSQYLNDNALGDFAIVYMETEAI